MTLRERIDRAAQAYEEEKAKLFRSDGSTKLYGPEEHAEREADLNRRFQVAMDTLEEDVDRQIEKAEEARLVAEDSDPTDLLTTEELASANARRPFVTDEVWRLSLDALQRRLRAVLAGSNRVSMFLYALYADQRVEESEENGAHEVREVVAELKKKVDPDGEKRREKVRKTIEEAHELKDHVYLRRRGAKDALGLYGLQTQYNIPTRR